MARGGRAPRWRGRWLALVGLSRALGDASADDDLWIVDCNTDCDGVDTCAGRELCVGEEHQEAVCEGNPRCPAARTGNNCVPKDCEWDTWSEWVRHDAAGLCSRKRSFTQNRCGGHPCMGSTSETIYCAPMKDSPQDCEFSIWSSWQACDKGTLQRIRERTVQRPPAKGGAPCVGSLIETEACGDRHKPVDCELTDWMSWSGCTRSCAGGQQTRVRAVLTQAAHGGQLCKGDNGQSVVLQITRACNSWECAGDTGALDCQLGPWSAWSDCSGDEKVLSAWEARGVAASKTQKFRSRVVVAAASQGGLPCSDKMEETAPCKDFASSARVLVKRDCKLSEWASWTLCDRTCEGGQTFRKRKVRTPAQNGGEPCEDLTSETMPCNEIPCSVNPEGSDCQLSAWSEWSSCSAQCGEGVEQRKRHILVPADKGGRGCNDILDETRPCEHPEPCAQTDCAWSTWTEWSTCSRTCDGGQRSRFRYVATPPSATGRPCDAHDSISEVEACGEESCSDEDKCVDGEWGEWTEWDTCSKSCGSGLQWRHRRILRQASPCGKAVTGEAEDVRECSTEKCDGDHDCDMGTWTMWSACSASCNGVQSRSRTVTSLGSGSGQHCEGSKKGTALNEVRSCNAPNELLLQAQAPGFADIIEECGYGEPVDCQLGRWSEWSPCSVSCGGGDRTRNRTIAQRPRNGGEPCGGSLGEIGVCNTDPCEAPKDCEWSEWGEWGSCTECDGEKFRTRTIAERGNAMGKPCEQGAAKEVAQCNECEEVKTYWCIWSEWSKGACSVTCGPGQQKRTRELLKTETVPQNKSDALGKVVGEEGSCEGTEADYVTCADEPVCAAGCVPEDCKLSDWSEWSEPTCNGLCRSHRTIERQANRCGKPCEGLLETSKSCESHCDGTNDCKLSAWSEWTKCEHPGGQRSRGRRILAVPGPFGNACTSDLQETKPCDEQEEALRVSSSNCILAQWGEWTECSRTCGGGQRQRERTFLAHATVGGQACEGGMSEVASCASGPCPVDTQNVDCVVSKWSSWSGCDGSHSLQAFRTRSLTPAVGLGLPCEGPIKESGECPKPKPVDCAFEEWAPWGECGASCGGGQRFRTRQVAEEASHGGKECEGFLDQSEPCNEIPCDAELDCVLSEWTAWSPCDMKCGTGIQQRERKLVRGAHPGGNGCGAGLKQVRGCKGDDCFGDQDCVWGEWQEWGGCERAEFCGMGVRKRTREIAIYPQGDGKLCDPLSSEEVAPSALCMGHCDRKMCINGEWGEWGPFGACSVTCGGGGVRMQSRWEKTKANYCGVPAEGDQQRFEECSADVACEGHDSVDCGFQQWGPWESECSSWCNGIRTRSREYTLPTNGGEACSGATMESVRCNPAEGEQPPASCESGTPVDCKQSEWEQWSACSAKCGTGHKKRRRQVIQPPSFGGKDCENPFEEIEECFAALPCPDTSMNCEWGEWEAWSTCDPIRGQRARERRVKRPKVGMGLDCEGPQKEVGECEKECKDKKYFCLWSEWAPWSTCSTTCGSEGRLTRKRVLTVSPVPQAGEEAFIGGAEKKFELPSVQLASEASRRQRELAIAFVCGLLSLGVVLVSGRRFVQRLRAPTLPDSLPLHTAMAGHEGRRFDLELQT